MHLHSTELPVLEYLAPLYGTRSQTLILFSDGSNFSILDNLSLVFSRPFLMRTRTVHLPIRRDLIFLRMRVRKSNVHLDPSGIEVMNRRWVLALTRLKSLDHAISLHHRYFSGKTSNLLNVRVGSRGDRAGLK